MSATLTAIPGGDSLADLLEQLGSVAPARIRYRPFPGTATEQDVFDIHVREQRLYELLDGVLVEKVMGFRESCLAGAILALLREFVRPRRLGLVTGPDGMMRLAPGLVCIPDVSFIAWKRVPGGRMPAEPIPNLAPDLAVEVLSLGNTPGEMKRKRREYFAAGVSLLWLVDPLARTVEVCTSADESTALTENDTLDGGTVLPGFSISLQQLFAELDEEAQG